MFLISYKKLNQLNYGILYIFQDSSLLKKQIIHNLKAIICTVRVLGQLIDLKSPAKINLFETRFKSYDPWDMANSLLCFFNKKIED